MSRVRLGFEPGSPGSHSETTYGISESALHVVSTEAGFKWLHLNAPNRIESTSIPNHLRSVSRPNADVVPPEARKVLNIEVRNYVLANLYTAVSLREEKQTNKTDHEEPQARFPRVCPSGDKTYRPSDLSIIRTTVMQVSPTSGPGSDDYRAVATE
ncbi:hypothetical protein Bbelb_397440 [Branchiostoma belcheri]|nr:hypothetical protein Bbelb_397440 [Branchiostoma belcheri]